MSNIFYFLYPDRSFYVLKKTGDQWTKERVYPDAEGVVVLAPGREVVMPWMVKKEDPLRRR